MIIIPTILGTKPPAALLIRQWKAAFDVGKLLSPGASLVGAAGFGYLARVVPSSTAARLYAAAAVTVFGIHPFTLLTLMPTNNALMQGVKAADAKEQGDENKEGALSEAEARTLVTRWENYNWVRALLPIASVGLGTWAMAAA